MVGAAAAFLGFSATIASVVISRPGDRRRILQGAAHHLGRVDDALGDQVAVGAGLGVVAPGVVGVLHDLADDDRAVLTGVAGDLPRRSLQGAANDVDADLLVLVLDVEAVERLEAAQEGDAAAGQDAFLDGGARRVQRVVDAVLALLDLDLGGAADLDDGHAAGELGQALLQLLLVVVGGGLLDLRLDLLDARLDVGLLAGAVDDGGVVLVDRSPSWRGPAC